MRFYMTIDCPYCENTFTHLFDVKNTEGYKEGYKTVECEMDESAEYCCERPFIVYWSLDINYKTSPINKEMEEENASERMD